MTITTERVTLTEAERAQARADLNHDERIFHDASIEEALDEIELEIARIRRIARNIPTDHDSPALALELVEAVGRQYKPRGKVATIMHLLGLVQNAAVLQARAHTATWEAIADKTGETRNNLHGRFNG